jgi:DNA mismatch repair ATPase MutS
LYHTKELTELIDYTIGLHGYLHCMEKLKKLNKCTFSTETKFIKAYYPIQKPIKNTYDLKNMIVTGPNASGKTTFLKMTMINVLMSQQFGCGFYKSATICPYETFACYVNIPDTCGRDSLFQAEARRCKEIIDADKTKRTLCIFDELFSGTNPEEAIATGSSMLRYLVKYSTFDFLLTTHFVELCKELKDEIYMKQMKDYKLKNGISFIKGGIRVLEEMNFPSSIVSEAKTLCG